MSDQPVRAFPLAVILTITTDITLASVGDVHELLNHMTGDDLYIHQLPRAGGECKPHLLAQHPDLADIVVPAWPDGATWDGVREWLDSLAPRYGTEREVRPLAPEDHASIDPLVELIDMRKGPRRG